MRGHYCVRRCVKGPCKRTTSTPEVPHCLVGRGRWMRGRMGGCVRFARGCLVRGEVRENIKGCLCSYISVHWFSGCVIGML